MKRFPFPFLIAFALYMLIPSSAFSQDISTVMREGDVLWGERKIVDKAKAALDTYKKVLEVDTNNYEACWKIARAYFYLGDLLPETKEMRDQHKELGWEGMGYAKRALELNPQGIEGHYYYALTLAQYSIGISIIKALAKGLGPEYEKHIGEALKTNKLYDNAGPLRAMGRYWYQLPWPKRNIKKSISYLEKAVACAPTTIRGYVYLAESYLEGGEMKLAQECLQKASALPADITQEVDAERWRESAKVLLKEKF